jgi:hypothetical protein
MIERSSRVVIPRVSYSEALGFVSTRGQGILTEIIRDFVQPLKANAGAVKLGYDRFLL